MKKLALIVAVAAGLAAAPIAMAQTGSVPPKAQLTQCAAKGTQKACADTPNAQTKSGKKAQGAAARTSAAPKVGASGKKGQEFQRGKNSRFSTPPKGQEYRVVSDHLVLVDTQNLKIVKVLGLLDSLTK